MAITTAQIHTVADELAAAGKRPTLAAVRQALGGGSFTTISEAMNEWNQAHRSNVTPIREPAPQAIGDRMATLAAEIWTVAMETANQRMQAEREALEATRAELEASKTEAAELADQMAIEIEQLKAALAATQDQLETERLNAAEKNQTAAIAKHEAALHATTNERLNKDLETTRQDARKAIEEAAELRGKLAAFTEH